MIPSVESTRIGFTKPNSTMDAAICATCSGECVRAFLDLAGARGTDPDPIRRDQLAYREAATLAD